MLGRRLETATKITYPLEGVEQEVEKMSLHLQVRGCSCMRPETRNCGYVGNPFIYVPLAINQIWQGGKVGQAGEGPCVPGCLQAPGIWHVCREH